MLHITKNEMRSDADRNAFDLADLSNQVASEIWMSAGVGEERFNMAQ
jgi:hypothetical protein